MKTCVLCTHDKRAVIESGLADGLTPAVLAGRYHVAKKLIELHAMHGRASSLTQHATERTRLDEEAIDASCSACAERPSRRLQRAWLDAKDDRSERQRMLVWLNDQLQSDGMGIP